MPFFTILILHSYVSTILGSIAKGQITNGGPVIMTQVENE